MSEELYNKSLSNILSRREKEKKEFEERQEYKKMLNELISELGYRQVGIDYSSLWKIGPHTFNINDTDQYIYETLLEEKLEKNGEL